MVKNMQCTSCKKTLDKNGVIFKCPGCNKEIIRCHDCKKLGVKYRCECGLEGP